eukprot:3827237-Amphidinium_carterae.1
MASSKGALPSALIRMRSVYTPLTVCKRCFKPVFNQFFHPLRVCLEAAQACLIQGRTPSPNRRGGPSINRPPHPSTQGVVPSCRRNIPWHPCSTTSVRSSPVLLPVVYRRHLELSRNDGKHLEANFKASQGSLRWIVKLLLEHLLSKLHKR